MVSRIDWKNCQSHWIVSTMGINFRTLLPFLLFYFIKGSLAQLVVVNTYTNKLVETLNCSFTSTDTTVQWIDQPDGGNPMTVFWYDVSTRLAQKHSNDRKYDNFNYSIEGTNGFNLVITNVDRGDGGSYQCNRIPPSSFVTFDVTVEVLPESISIDCTELNVCMPSSEREAVPQINCVCTATVLSSSVLKIEWEGVEVSTASNTTRVESPTSGSCIISSNTTFPPPNGTSSLSCSLTGYRSQIPEKLRSFTYRFTPPECNMVHDCPSDGTSASLICNCSKGSPKVNTYSFYNSEMSPIGTQRTSSMTVQVETNKTEIFYCSGCNGVHNQTVGHEFNCKQVGTEMDKDADTDTSKDADADDRTPEKGPASWIIVVILLIVVFLLLVVLGIIVLAVKKPWSPTGKVDIETGQNLKKKRLEEPLLSKNTSVQEQKGQNPRRTKSEPPSRDPESEMDYRKAKNEASGGDSAHKNDDRPKPEPKPAPRSSQPPGINREPEELELQYADIDHGNRGPSNEIRQPADAPTEYATVHATVQPVEV